MKDKKEMMNEIRDRARYPYMPLQAVSFNCGEIKGTGKIYGMATTEIPVIGTIWIVKPDSPIEGYSYECIAVPSLHLQPLEPI